MKNLSILIHRLVGNVPVAPGKGEEPKFVQKIKIVLTPGLSKFLVTGCIIELRLAADMRR